MNSCFIVNKNIGSTNCFSVTTIKGQGCFSINVIHGTPIDDAGGGTAPIHIPPEWKMIEIHVNSNTSAYAIASNDNFPLDVFLLDISISEGEDKPTGDSYVDAIIVNQKSLGTGVISQITDLVGFDVTSGGDMLTIAGFNNNKSNILNAFTGSIIATSNETLNSFFSPTQIGGSRWYDTINMGYFSPYTTAFINYLGTGAENQVAHWNCTQVIPNSTSDTIPPHQQFSEDPYFNYMIGTSAPSTNVASNCGGNAGVFHEGVPVIEHKRRMKAFDASGSQITTNYGSFYDDLPPSETGVFSSTRDPFNFGDVVFLAGSKVFTNSATYTNPFFSTIKTSPHIELYYTGEVFAADVTTVKDRVQVTSADMQGDIFKAFFTVSATHILCKGKDNSGQNAVFINDLSGSNGFTPLETYGGPRGYSLFKNNVISVRGDNKIYQKKIASY